MTNGGMLNECFTLRRYHRDLSAHAVSDMKTVIYHLCQVYVEA